MGKKKNWFTYVKRAFTSEPKPTSEEKYKNWRWLAEKIKFKHYPAIEAPQRTLNEAAEDQRKHAMAVAIAIAAAAAEAAAAAANAAAEVVRLTNISIELERKNLHLAAIKIRTCYRGHLARKALSALKGIVKLQAFVRGEQVRRDIIKKIVSMSLFPKAQTLVQRARIPGPLDYLSHSERRHSQNEELKFEELNLHFKTNRRWDFSPQQSYPPKRTGVTGFINEQNHQYISTKEQRNLILNSDSNTTAVETKLAQLKLRTSCKQETLERLNSSFSLPRRSFSHPKQKSIGDDGSLPKLSMFPAYMAATESVKAKSRSSSTPKQRLKLSDPF